MNVTPPVDTDWMLNFGYAALEELAKNSGAEPGAELTLIIYDATAARIPSPGDTIHAWVVACTTHGFVPALVGPPEFVAFDHWNIHASEEEPPPTSDAPSPTDPTADLRADTGATTLIYPEQHATVGAPSYVKGALYFDTTLNKLRVGGASAWETVTSA